MVRHFQYIRYVFCTASLPNIVLLYDGDEAGQHAALRGTDMLLAEGMNVKVLLLPDGKDPDEFARSYSAEDFRKYIEDNQTDLHRHLRLTYY